MANIIIYLFLFVLLVTCGLMTIIILMQKPSANAGMGAALGGGAAESVFGGETASVLLKYTVRIAVAFFLLSFFLYMGLIARNQPTVSAGASLPKFPDMVPTAPAPASTTTAPGVTSKTTVTTSADATKPLATTPAASTTPAPASSTAK